MSPNEDIQYLKGVGPKLGDLFKRQGIQSLRQLIEFVPRTYEDRRAARSIASLQANELVSIKVQVVGTKSYYLGHTHKKVYEVMIKDFSGVIICRFFRIPYKGYFERFTQGQNVGKEVRVVGKVLFYRGRLEFHHPDIRDLNPNEDLQDVLLPVYVEIEGLSSQKIMTLVREALALFDPQGFEDKLPQWLLTKYKLPSRYEAYRQIHCPEVERANEFLTFRSAGHRRLIFEEFFWLELYLAVRRAGYQKEEAPILKGSGVLSDQLLKSLPFALTGSQLKSLREIEIDLEKGSPMHRLVQGDVGSGKTLVAFLSCLIAVEAGYQAAVMVPTEILAEQHFTNATKLLSPLGVKVVLLTGKMKANEKKEVLRALRPGEKNRENNGESNSEENVAAICVGTHALLEEEVEFKNLGLVIIDEQHRFGVHQRALLKSKGVSPHFLVMTATPIPRTLAMTVYGDLDVSVIDEMPKGRTPIQTRVVYDAKRSEVLQFLFEQVQKGRQGYFVYPLVAESEKMDLKDAISSFESLKIQFPFVRWGLLHGRMKPEEKEQVMQSFRQHEIDVLVSTTVIEVGVDVPNANIIIVEHAERFGLSQLHQLRGRVGRGEFKSFCILMLGHAVSAESKARAQIMESTLDGFKVAEADLEMRGPGEFLGTKQSGLPGFQMANIVRDVSILNEAKQAASAVVERDPQLKSSENRELLRELNLIASLGQAIG